MSTQSIPPFDALVDVDPILLTFSVNCTSRYLYLYNFHSHPVRFSIRLHQNAEDKYFISQKKGVVSPGSRNTIVIFHKDVTSLNSQLDVLRVSLKQSDTEDGQRPLKCFKKVYARLVNDDHAPPLPQALLSKLALQRYVHPETRLRSLSRDSLQGRIHTNTPQGSVRTGDAPQGSVRINGAPQGSSNTGSTPRASICSGNTPQGSNRTSNTPQGSVRINGAPQGSSNTSSTPWASIRTGDTPQGSNRTRNTPQGSVCIGDAPQGTIHVNGTSAERAQTGSMPSDQQKVSHRGLSGREFLATLVGVSCGLYLLTISTRNASPAPARAIARTVTAMFTGIMAQLMWQWFWRGMATQQARGRSVHWESDPQDSPVTVDKTQPTVESVSLHILGLMGTVYILYVSYGHPAWGCVVMEHIRNIIAGISGMLFKSVCRRLWQETAGRHRQSQG